MKRNIELAIHATPGVGNAPRATRAEVKAVAAYLSALGDSPADTDIKIGSLTISMYVDRCQKCWGTGKRWEGPVGHECADCNGTGKEFDPSPAGVGG